MEIDRECYTESECDAELDQLFPNGFSGPDVKNEIPFDNINWIPADDLVENERNIRELVGRCVWDIFSDGHDVIGSDGRLVDLGSFRRTGEVLADWQNRRSGCREFDYMTFYLGTSAPWSEPKSDLTSIYEIIFRRLKLRGLDWTYHFPRLHLVDFRPLREAMDRQGKPDWEGYSPSESFAQAEEEKQRDRKIAEFREKLENGRNEAIEEALKQPPPATVRAYRAVFGRWPEGWPPCPGE